MSTHQEPPPGPTPEEFWEARYRDTERVWTGRVNPQLVVVASSLSPGDALDLGCGEGGDSLWLARQGWRVTAVDISGTALRRTADRAAAAGLSGRVRTARHDLAVDFPDGTFDLVNAHYLQSPVALPRAEVLTTAATRVRPGGRLLLVDHGSSAPWMHHHDDRLPGPQEALDAVGLDLDGWRVERLDSPERTVTGPGGVTATVLDTVVVLRRSPAERRRGGPPPVTIG